MGGGFETWEHSQDWFQHAPHCCDSRLVLVQCDSEHEAFNHATSCHEFLVLPILEVFPYVPHCSQQGDPLWKSFDLVFVLAFGEDTDSKATRLVLVVHQAALFLEVKLSTHCKIGKVLNVSDEIPGKKGKLLL